MDELSDFIGKRRLYSRVQLQEKFSFWGNRCWICGKYGSMTKDHVKPKSVGGPDILANIRPACLPCNAMKKDTWPFPAAALLVQVFFAGE